MTFKAAFQDVYEGFQNREFWLTFGMNDIKSKYRRSKLGQWWITLSVAIFVAVIGSLYGGIFNTSSAEYFVYLSTGYVIWIFLSDIVNTGSSSLIAANNFLNQRNWPKSVFFFRVVYREILIFLHNAVIIVVVFLWCRHWPGIQGLLGALVGLALIIFTSFWVIMILSILTLRFRDMQPIIQSLMRMVFFATPIIWMNRNLGQIGTIVIQFNPFRYFLDIFREPLLGHGMPWNELGISALISFVAMIIGLTVLRYSKDKINYWL